MPHLTPSVERQVVRAADGSNFLVGHRKYRPIIPHGHEGPELKSCYIGTRDIRDCLASAAFVADNPALLQQYKKLEFHLIGLHPTSVHAIIVQHIIKNINPSKDEDIEFLWACMYNAALPKSWQTRLGTILNDLAVAILHPNGMPEYFLDTFLYEMQNYVHILLEALQNNTLPPMTTVTKMRYQRLKDWFETDMFEDDEADFDDKLLKCCISCSNNFYDQVEHKLNSLDERKVDDEIGSYYFSGSLYSSKETVEKEEMVANPLMLWMQGKEWKYFVHQNTNPFDIYLPLSKELADTVRGLLANSHRHHRAVTTVCLAELKKLVQGYKKCVSSGVEVHIKVVPVLGREGLFSAVFEGGVLKQHSYDVVDTDTIVDDKGYLSTLVCGEYLLKPLPTSRLYTTSMYWWKSKAESFKDFLELALAADAKFYPTIFGLRLVQDIELGLESPQNILAYISPLKPNAVSLEWMPIEKDITTPLAFPKRDGFNPFDPLSKAIKKVIHTSLKSLDMMMVDDDLCGLSTPSSLAVFYLLCSMTSRVSDLLPPRSSVPILTWKSLATHWINLFKIPKQWHLQFQALCCWAFCDPSQGPGPVKLRGVGDVCSEIMHKTLGIGDNAKPMLLATIYIPTAKPEVIRDSFRRAEAIRFLPSSGANQPHVVAVKSMLEDAPLIDIIYTDLNNNKMCFMLPPDHGLDLKKSQLILMDPVNGFCVGHVGTPLNSFTKEAIVEPPPPWLRSTFQRFKSLHANSSQETSAKGGIEVVVVEYHNMYEMWVLKPDKGADYKLNIVWDDTKLTSTEIKITMTGGPRGVEPKEYSTTLKLSHPVGTAQSTQGEDKIKYTLYFKKRMVWQIDDKIIPKIDIEALEDSELIPGMLGKNDEKLINEPTMEYRYMRNMFTMSQYFIHHHKFRETYDFSPIMQLRALLKNFFVSTWSVGPQVYTVDNSKAPPGASSSQTIALSCPVMLAVHGAKVLPNGAPLLHVSFQARDITTTGHGISGRRADAFTMEGAKFMDQWSCMVGQKGCAVKKSKSSVVPLTESVGVIELLIDILHRNSLRIQPPEWQKEYLVSDKWRASYITPLYHDKKFTPQDIEMQLNNVMPGSDIEVDSETGGSSTAAAAAGSSTFATNGNNSSGRSESRAPPRAEQFAFAIEATKKGKEEGNKLYKAGRYFHALMVYQSAYKEAMKVMFGDNPSPQSPGFCPPELARLIVDILNNQSQAAKKIHETEDVDDETKADMCNMVLTMTELIVTSYEPMNHKAWFKRAWAYYHMKQYRQAEDAINKLRNSTDEAVLALKAEIQNALRPSLDRRQRS